MADLPENTKKPGADTTTERKAAGEKPHEPSHSEVTKTREKEGNRPVKAMEPKGEVKLPDCAFVTDPKKEVNAGGLKDGKAEESGKKENRKPGEKPDSLDSSGDRSSESDKRNAEIHYDLLKQHPELVPLLGLSTDKLNKVISAAREDLQRQGYDPQTRSMGIGPEPGTPTSPFVDRNKLWRPNPDLQHPENPGTVDMLAKIREQKQAKAGENNPSSSLLHGNEADKDPFHIAHLTDPKGAEQKRRQDAIAYQLANATPDKLNEYKQLQKIEKALERDPKMLEPKTLLEMVKRDPKTGEIKLSDEQRKNLADRLELQKPLRLVDTAATKLDPLNTLYEHERWRADSPLHGKDNPAYLNYLDKYIRTASNFDLIRGLGDIDLEKQLKPDLNQNRNDELNKFQTNIREQLAHRLSNKVEDLEISIIDEEARNGWVNTPINTVNWNAGKADGRLAGFLNSDTTPQAARDQLAQANKACEKLSEFPANESNAKFIEEWRKQTFEAAKSLQLAGHHLGVAGQAADGRVEALSRGTEMMALGAGYLAAVGVAPLTEGTSLAAAIPMMPPLAAAAGRVLPNLLESKTAENPREHYGLTDAFTQGGISLAINSPIMPGSLLASKFAGQGAKNLAVRGAENLAVHGAENLAVHGAENLAVHGAENLALKEAKQVAEEAASRSLMTRAGEAFMAQVEKAPTYSSIAGLDGFVTGYAETLAKTGSHEQALIAGTENGLTSAGVGPVVMSTFHGVGQGAKAIAKNIRAPEVPHIGASSKGATHTSDMVAGTAAHAEGSLATPPGRVDRAHAAVAGPHMGSGKPNELDLAYAELPDVSIGQANGGRAEAASGRGGENPRRRTDFQDVPATAIMRDKSRGMTPGDHEVPQAMPNPTHKELPAEIGRRLDTDAARTKYDSLAETGVGWKPHDIEKAVILSTGEFADLPLDKCRPLMRADLEHLRSVSQIGGSATPTFLRLAEAHPDRLASASKVACTGGLNRLTEAQQNALVSTDPSVLDKLTSGGNPLTSAKTFLGIQERCNQKFPINSADPALVTARDRSIATVASNSSLSRLNNDRLDQLVQLGQDQVERLASQADPYDTAKRFFDIQGKVDNAVPLAANADANTIATRNKDIVTIATSKTPVDDAVETFNRLNVARGQVTPHADNTGATDEAVMSHSPHPTGSGPHIASRTPVETVAGGGDSHSAASIPTEGSTGTVEPPPSSGTTGGAGGESTHHRSTGGSDSTAGSPAGSESSTTANSPNTGNTSASPSTGPGGRIGPRPNYMRPTFGDEDGGEGWGIYGQPGRGEPSAPKSGEPKSSARESSGQSEEPKPAARQGRGKEKNAAESTAVPESPTRAGEGHSPSGMDESEIFKAHNEKQRAELAKLDTATARENYAELRQSLPDLDWANNDVVEKAVMLSGEPFSNQMFPEGRQFLMEVDKGILKDLQQAQLTYPGSSPIRRFLGLNENPDFQPSDRWTAKDRNTPQHVYNPERAKTSAFIVMSKLRDMDTYTQHVMAGANLADLHRLAALPDPKAALEHGMKAMDDLVKYSEKPESSWWGAKDSTQKAELKAQHDAHRAKEIMIVTSKINETAPHLRKTLYENFTPAQIQKIANMEPSVANQCVNACTLKGDVNKHVELYGSNLRRLSDNQQNMLLRNYDIDQLSALARVSNHNPNAVGQYLDLVSSSRGFGPTQGTQARQNARALYDLTTQLADKMPEHNFNSLLGALDRGANPQNTQKIIGLSKLDSTILSDSEKLEKALAVGAAADYSPLSKLSTEDALVVINHFNEDRIYDLANGSPAALEAAIAPHRKPVAPVAEHTAPAVASPPPATGPASAPPSTPGRIGGPGNVHHMRPDPISAHSGGEEAHVGSHAPGTRRPESPAANTAADGNRTAAKGLLGRMTAGWRGKAPEIVPSSQSPAASAGSVPSESPAFRSFYDKVEKARTLAESANHDNWVLTEVDGKIHTIGDPETVKKTDALLAELSESVRSLSPDERATYNQHLEDRVKTSALELEAAEKALDEAQRNRLNLRMADFDDQVDAYNKAYHRAMAESQRQAMGNRILGPG